MYPDNNDKGCTYPRLRLSMHCVLSKISAFPRRDFRIHSDAGKIFQSIDQDIGSVTFRFSYALKLTAALVP